jgi:hypothetical protein
LSSDAGRPNSRAAATSELRASTAWVALVLKITGR